MSNQNTGPFADPTVRAAWQHTAGQPSIAVKARAAKMRRAPFASRGRCPDCGARGETRGHQTCQYPTDY